MAITKPYYRIWHPMKGYTNSIDAMFDESISDDNLDYLKDNRFINQKESQSLVTAARLIVIDVHELFTYIEPCDANLSVYSHRIYELLLRTATEFEANCKGILMANQYSHSRNLSIQDYYKINSVSHLSEYIVQIHQWQDIHSWQPLKEWATGSSLTWYQAYNHVKHNRYSHFREANLQNLMDAVTSLLCVLFSQMCDEVGAASINGLSIIQNKQEEVTNNTFTITAPTFSDDELYDFDWKVLKTSNQPFDVYTF